MDQPRRFRQSERTETRPVGRLPELPENELGWSLGDERAAHVRAMRRNRLSESWRCKAAPGAKTDSPDRR